MPIGSNRVTVAVLWLTMLLIVSAAWLAGTSSARHPTRVLLQGGGSRAPVGWARERTAVPPPPVTDILGNTIEKAVMDYRVDDGGDTYETHSPDTALTNLGSPGV